MVIEIIEAGSVKLERILKYLNFLLSFFPDLSFSAICNVDANLGKIIQIRTANFTMFWVFFLDELLLLFFMRMYRYTLEVY